jgi:hypothetical protein
LFKSSEYNDGVVVGAVAAPGLGTHVYANRDNPLTAEVSPDRPERVRLIGVSGVFLREIDASEAHALIRERRAVGIGNKRRIRAVQLLVVEFEGRKKPRALLPFGLVGQRYSHNHATSDNPEGVWTLRRLSAHDAKTDLAIHIAHIDSLLECMTQQQRDAMICSLGLMRGLRRKDLREFLNA